MIEKPPPTEAPGCAIPGCGLHGDGSGERWLDRQSLWVSRALTVGLLIGLVLLAWLIARLT